ncbi:MAG: oligosaccharide flippase family protein [bacterium]|nr:oligosaccharide flippase family protein [bacterium]
MASRFWHNAFYLTVEKGAHLLGGLLLMVGVARWMGEQVLGQYAFVISWTALFVPALDMGLNNRIIKQVAIGDVVGEQAVHDAMGFKLLVGPIVLGLMVAGAWAMGKPAEILVAVLLVGGSTLAMSLGDALNAIFKGLQRSGYSALLLVGLNGALLVLGLAGMAFGIGLIGIAGAYLVCRVGYWGAGMGFASRVVSTYRLRFRPTVQWERVIQGVYLLPTPYFLGALLHLNFITTDLFVSDPVSAHFAIGYRLAAALFVLGGASLEVFLPSLTERFQTARDLKPVLFRGGMAFLGLTILGVVIVQVAAETVTIWVFGQAYLAAVEPIRLLAWTVPPFVLCGLAHTALLAMDRERKGFGVMLGLVGLGFVVGGIGMFLGGAYGVALAPTGLGCVFACVLWGMVWQELREIDDTDLG